jgi:hypothetical protein
MLCPNDDVAFSSDGLMIQLVVDDVCMVDMVKAIKCAWLNQHLHSESIVLFDKH